MFDRAVNNNFFLLKPDVLMGGYDQACDDDVVEEIKNLLVISKADHIEDLESLVDNSDKWLK